MLIGRQEAAGEHAGAVGADVDGLAHMKIIAITEIEAHEHSLLHALFGTLTRGRVVHGNTSLPTFLADIRPGGVLTRPS
jgi:hypothetical protein